LQYFHPLSQRGARGDLIQFENPPHSTFSKGEGTLSA
jgi:hypothetical protein